MPHKVSYRSLNKEQFPLAEVPQSFKVEKEIPNHPIQPATTDMESIEEETFYAASNNLVLEDDHKEDKIRNQYLL